MTNGSVLHGRRGTIEVDSEALLQPCVDPMASGGDG